jgi:acyl-CoA thioester hydrolase
MKKKIYYHDTDCGGVVYYANYLKYFEEARSEFLNERGVSIKLLAQEGTFFMVARTEVDYKAPLAYADTLEIKTSISEIGAAKIIFEQETLGPCGQLINKSKTVLVCVGRDMRPKPIPVELRSKIEDRQVG